MIRQYTGKSQKMLVTKGIVPSKAIRHRTHARRRIYPEQLVVGEIY